MLCTRSPPKSQVQKARKGRLALRASKEIKVFKEKLENRVFKDYKENKALKENKEMQVKMVSVLMIFGLILGMKELRKNLLLP